MKSIFVRLLSETGDKGAAHIDICVAVDGTQSFVRTMCPLAELNALASEHADAATMVLLVPGEAVLQTDAFIPSTSQWKIQQAAPFVMEDRLLTDIDQLHIATGSVSADRRTTIAVVAHERMQRWLAASKEAGLQVTETVAETALVPLADSSKATILVDHNSGKALIRSADSFAVCSRFENVAFYLRNMLSVGDEESAGLDAMRRNELLFIGWDDSMPAIANDALSGFCLQHEVRFAKTEQAVIATLVATYYREKQAGGSAIDLLQGIYRSRVRWQDNLSWRWVACAALAVACMQVVFNYATGLYLDSKAADIERRSYALYQDMFPADSRVINIRTQMENHLLQKNLVGGDNRFLALLAVVSGHIGSSLDLKFIRYDQAKSELLLELTAASLGDLDEFERGVEAQGLLAEVMSAVQNESGISGRIAISPGSTSLVRAL